MAGNKSQLATNSSFHLVKKKSHNSPQFQDDQSLTFCKKLKVRCSDKTSRKTTQAKGTLDLHLKLVSLSPTFLLGLKLPNHKIFAC